MRARSSPTASGPRGTWPRRRAEGTVGTAPETADDSATADAHNESSNSRNRRRAQHGWGGRAQRQGPYGLRRSPPDGTRALAPGVGPAREAFDARGDAPRHLYKGQHLAGAKQLLNLADNLLAGTSRLEGEPALSDPSYMSPRVKSIIGGLAALLGLVLRYLVPHGDHEPPWAPIAAELTHDLALAGIVFVLGATLLRGLTPEDEIVAEFRKISEPLKSQLDRVADLTQKSMEAQVVRAGEFNAFMAAMRASTATYTFAGNTGSHFTTVTIPGLASQQMPVRVRCQLLDPMDDAACRQYAQTRAYDGMGTTAENIALEAVATVVSIYLWSRRSRIDFDMISLRGSVAQLRVDHADRASLLSSEGRDDPGLAIHGERAVQLYRHTTSILEAQLRNGRQLPPPRQLNLPTVSRDEDVTADHVITILQSINMVLPANITAAHVVEMLRTRKNRYDRAA